MSKREFKSSLAPMMAEFLRIKETMGYKIKRYRIVLEELDDILLFSEHASITREDFERWVKGLTNNSPTTIYQKALYARVFTRYLRSSGHDAYVPPIANPPFSNFSPYIYSMEEIAIIFKNADNLISEHFTVNNNLFSFPILLRLLYATGLRIGEALHLKNEDMDLQQRVVKIRDTKNSQERMLPLSDSLVKSLSQYVSYRNRLNCKVQTQSPECYYFVSSSGTKLNPCSIGRWFRIVLKRSGIPFVGSGKGPRIHDLRHTFAVHSLIRMVRENKSIDLYLPVLGAYLGHKHISSTEHYVRLTMDMFPDIRSKMEQVSSYVFPQI